MTQVSGDCGTVRTITIGSHETVLAHPAPSAALLQLFIATADITIKSLQPSLPDRTKVGWRIDRLRLAQNLGSPAINISVRDLVPQTEVVA